MKLCIGIDFDNTIICYDSVFNKIGVEKGFIPVSLPQGKGYVRQYLRKIGKEDEWTWLQGYVYGTKLESANLYEGVTTFLKFCKQEKFKCFIVSHKTKYPYAGEKYDLHNAASDWIRTQGLDIDFFFEETKEEKINRINALSCSHFIDDLPEFLALPGFGKKIKKILFDPLRKYKAGNYKFQCVTSWGQILAVIKNES